ncbi:MAG: aldose 1-epimerase family protein [Muribaculaceae bacterium]|nr:aldose 1-epimerase family protein [Muribaculaceae bacterium]
MSYIELKNGSMAARITTLGAELVSLKKNGREYLWQADPKYWNGRSPLLFPNCGSFWNGVYRYNGQTYSLQKHGFARQMEFSVVNQSETEVTLGIRSTDETLKSYPFPFFLFVTYRLGESDLKVEWFVRNEGDNEMFYAIGAHPAFYLPDFDPAQPVRGYFSFATNKPVEYLIPTEKGCVDDLHPQTLQLDDQGMMPITASTFDIDTYVIESADISRCTLLSAERVPFLAVDFHMPVLSLWSPTAQHPDCPFVAIEPWNGSCDTVGFTGELSERRHINSLAPGAHALTAYTITIF